MKKRVITGIGFTIVLIAGMVVQGLFLRAILLFSALLSMHEMYAALQAKQHKAIAPCGYAFVLCALALTWAQSVGKLTALHPGFTALLFGAVLTSSVVVLRGKVDFDAFAATLLPMIYPGVFFCCLFSLQDLGDRQLISRTALALSFFTASVNDVFALLIGVRFGKHRLSPEISPKKSIEGSVAGLIAGTLFSMLVAAILPKISCLNPVGTALPPIWAFALLGLICAALSQIGDLTASLVKRHCGIKDYGKLLPGHGGMMDRLDGVLFCTAACSLFFHIVA